MSPRARRRPIVVNGAFRSQRITGQQRYASEIAGLLPYPEAVPPDWLSSSLGAWAWCQALPLLKAGSRIVTLTSRGPFFARQVLVVHDMFVFDHPEWYSWRYRITHQAAQAIQMRLASVIVCVSEPVRDRIARRFPNKRVIVAPNAPAAPFLAVREDRVAAADRVRKRFGLAGNEFFLTVGSRDPRKNLAAIDDAHGALPQAIRSRFPLVSVGAVNEAVFGSEGGNSAASTRSLGYVTDGELADLYASARAVLFMPFDEGFGLPAVEAAAAGTPLIVSDIEVFRWVLGDGSATFVQPTDVRGIMEAMLRCVEGDGPIPVPKKTTLGAGRFSWASSARAIRDAIE